MLALYYYNIITYVGKGTMGECMAVTHSTEYVVDKQTFLEKKGEHNNALPSVTPYFVDEWRGWVELYTIRHYAFGIVISKCLNKFPFLF